MAGSQQQVFEVADTHDATPLQTIPSGRMQPRAECHDEGQLIAKQDARDKKPKGIARFKIIATAVKALQKWKNALSPTYVYGEAKQSEKQAAEEASAAPSRLMAARSLSGPPPKTSHADHQRTVSGRAGSGRPGSGQRTMSGRPVEGAGKVHGFKAALLFRPLPKQPVTTQA